MHIWGEDLVVLSQVQLKGIAGPTAFYLHNVEWNTSEQILKCSPDADAVAVHTIDPSSPSDFVEMDDEGLPCHQVVTFGHSVGKKGAIGRRVIDPNVLVEGIEWVSGTILLCPVDLLPCWAGLCAWESEHLGV